MAIDIAHWFRCELLLSVVKSRSVKQGANVGYGNKDCRQIH